MMKSVLIYLLVVVVNLITSIGFCLSDEPDKEKSQGVSQKGEYLSTDLAFKKYNKE